MMKKSLMVIFFLLFAAAGNAPAEAVKGPKIALRELRVDLGQIVQGKQASHVIEVVNEGTETLLIQKVQPG